MVDEDVVPYTDEEIEEWVKRNTDWEKFDQWQSYLLGRRQAYFNERQRSLGSEYHDAPQQWESIFEREWTVLEERLNSGIGVDAAAIERFGEDFFEKKQQLLDELDDIVNEMDTEELEENQSLVIYTFEDFIMLSNQGIFRDNIFILDPQRKWRKKVEEVLSEYGYTNIERINIKGVNYLVVSKGEQ